MKIAIPLMLVALIGTGLTVEVRGRTSEGKTSDVQRDVAQKGSSRQSEERMQKQGIVIPTKWDLSWDDIELIGRGDNLSVQVYVFSGKLRLEPRLMGETSLESSDGDLKTYVAPMTILGHWNPESSEATETITIEGNLTELVNIRLQCQSNPWINQGKNCVLNSVSATAENPDLGIPWEDVYKVVKLPITATESLIELTTDQEKDPNDANIRTRGIRPSKIPSKRVTLPKLKDPPDFRKLKAPEPPMSVDLSIQFLKLNIQDPSNTPEIYNQVHEAQKKIREHQHPTQDKRELFIENVQLVGRGGMPTLQVYLFSGNVRLKEPTPLSLSSPKEPKIYTGRMMVTGMWKAESNETTEIIKVEGDLAAAVNIRLKCSLNPWITPSQSCVFLDFFKVISSMKAGAGGLIPWKQVYDRLRRPITAGQVLIKSTIKPGEAPTGAGIRKKSTIQPPKAPSKGGTLPKPKGSP